MEPTCPKCGQPLPEVQSMEYRFCPHCGAEITAESKKNDNVYLTTPDLASRQPRQTPKRLKSGTEKEPALGGRFSDPTIEPQPKARHPQPKLKPPEAPPPSSFSRTSEAPTAAFRQDNNKKQSSKNRNKIIFAFLALLAVIILIIGLRFTF